MTKEPSSNGLAKAVHRPSMWLLAIAFLLITFFQYAEALHLAYLSDLNATLGLTRYTVERILYLLPIIWAGLLFGWRGGVITATLAVACMLPRGIYISPNPEDAIVESLAIFAVGTAVAFSLELLQKERERRTELEVAQKELQNQLRVIEEDERRLAALNRTSSIISQSLELPDVLESAINCVIYVMGVEVVRVYILDDDHEELILSAYHGVSAEFVEEVHRIKIGEGFNGRVARTGELLFVENTLDDPELTKAVVVEENIRSQIIVPMMAKGKVVGTIAAAMRSHRQFSSGETDLLIAIANQIGVAVDNARLYQFEKDSRE
ncbi:MAG: GAF domain-containing protein, partial [Chloroflexota bacterium]|nr:GAF domain-containing protein [Chloroflexota bacterium]